jgi:hypothetical protein
MKKAALKAAREKAAREKAATEAVQEKWRKQKAEEMQKLKGRTARRGTSRPSAAPQQNFPSTPQRGFALNPKQASYAFTASTEMGTGMFAETESDFTSSPPQRNFKPTSLHPSNFDFWLIAISIELHLRVIVIPKLRDTSGMETEN